MKLSVILLTATLFTGVASAETIRLVMSDNAVKAKSGKITTLSQKSTGCVSSINGDAQWCIGVSTKSKVSAKSVSKTRSSVVFEVDGQGYSPQEIADAFNKDGRFGLVEVDIPIKSAGSFRPNDPEISRQTKYMDSVESSLSGINIFGLWDELGETAIKTKTNPVDVLVMDSSFIANGEVEYYDGRGFSTTALVEGGPRQERSDDYRPPAEVAALNCNNHGLGVASTINAKLDNGRAIAGITNNVNLYALKVMTCGTGFMSDVAAALDWLAGEPIDGVTPYLGGAGIVNMSLGGSGGSCPTYIQRSINKAVDAGFTIAVAASNDSIDVSDSAPANCDNVITIASIDESGDLADFSNFGSQIDVVAQGTTIQGMCNDDPGSACWWDGTSFSTPLVAGGLAIVKQATGASNEVLTAALELSSGLETLGAQCQQGICGKGLPDFKKVLDIARQSQAGTLHTIEFALKDADTCEQTWLVDYFGGKARLCELYKVTFYGGYIASDTTYELVSNNINEPWNSGSEISEGTFNQGSVLLSDLDTTNKKYGFKVCQNGLCGNVIEMDASNALADNRPVACLSE